MPSQEESLAKLRERMEAAAQDMRQSPPLQAFAKLTNIFGEIQIEGYKNQLRYLLRLWQPNIDDGELDELFDAMWALYERWSVYGLNDTDTNTNVRNVESGIDIDELARKLRWELDLDKPKYDHHIDSILGKASRHADTINRYVNGMDLNEEKRAFARRRRSMLRLSATLRDSLDQVAALYRGETLEEMPPREFESDALKPDVRNIYNIYEECQKPDPWPMADSPDQQMRNAYAYQKIKEAHKTIENHNAQSPDPVLRESVTERACQMLSEAMGIISGHLPLPDNKENTNG